MIRTGDPIQREVRFGISITPYAEAYPALVEQVLAAERGHLDLVGIQDHPYQRRFLDTFALIADLLARTSTLRARDRSRDVLGCRGRHGRRRPRRRRAR
jgi:hypothetical protein